MSMLSYACSLNDLRLERHEMTSLLLHTQIEGEEFFMLHHLQKCLVLVGRVLYFIVSPV